MSIIYNIDHCIAKVIGFSAPESKLVKAEIVAACTTEKYRTAVVQSMPCPMIFHAMQVSI